MTWRDQDQDRDRDRARSTQRVSTPWLRGFLTSGMVWLVLHPKFPPSHIPEHIPAFPVLVSLLMMFVRVIELIEAAFGAFHLVGHSSHQGCSHLPWKAII